LGTLIDRLRTALDEAHAQTGPTVLGGAAILELAGAVFDAWAVAPPARAFVVGMDLALVVVCLGLRAAWKRGTLGGALADVAWVALGALITCNMLVTMALTGQAAYGSFAMLVLVGAGSVMQTGAAFAVLATLVVIGWGVVGWRLRVVADPAPYAFGLLCGTVMGGVVLAARRRTHARIAVLRLRDRVRGERLRNALATARRTLAERERTEVEKEALRAALLQAQKLEAVGRLSAAVAHDINNVLAAILSAAEMLLADADLDAAGRDDAATIIASARRGADFTRNLLAVGRRGKYASDVLDPGEIVGGAVRVLEQALPVEIKLEVELGHGDAHVEGDLDQLTQVMVNLCINARAAMPDGGTIVVGTSVVTLEGAEAHRRAVAPGVYLAFSVTDSGEGMSSEDRQRAFEPFYAVATEAPSSGLGLAMAYGAARNHGGVAEIDSARGRGTVVTLYLPYAHPFADGQSRAPAATSSAPEGSPRAGAGADLRGKSVLLVDDEPSVRAVARRILERMDLRVREAENGRRALVAYSAEGPFDLVIVDLAMPVMGGKELFDRLRAVAPDARVVVVSGADGRGEAMDLIARGAVGVVEKPYTPGALARAARAALATRPRGASQAKSA
jgi:signal transduction histidine kinase/ActR/RegA family two-component response regulator